MTDNTTNHMTAKYKMPINSGIAYLILEPGMKLWSVFK